MPDTVGDKDFEFMKFTQRERWTKDIHLLHYNHI